MGQPGTDNAQISDRQNGGYPAFRTGLLLRNRRAQVWRDTIEGLQVQPRRKSLGLLVLHFDEPIGVSGHHLPDADAVMKCLYAASFSVSLASRTAALKPKSGLNGPPDLFFGENAPSVPI